MLKLCAAFIFMCWLNLSFANTNDVIHNLGAKAERQRLSISTESLQTFKALSDEQLAGQQTLIETLAAQANQQRTQKQGAHADGALLFVSFSMPEDLLLSLADEAAELNIPLIINGLVKGDFKTTIETFQRLNAEAKKKHLSFQGVSIDPVWFREFHITSVPALIVTAPSKDCGAQKVCAQAFDVVYGNARLKKSLELISEKGEAFPLAAKKILDAHHV